MNVETDIIVLGLSPFGLRKGDKPISDDDLCSTCVNCTYRPGELSSCQQSWPGFIDHDAYVQKCAEFQEAS